MSTIRNKLWEIADEFRGRPIDTLLILKTAKSRGIKFDLEDVILLLTKDKKSDLFCCPYFISKFIQNYLKDNPINSILDTSAGIGALVAPIVYGLAPNQAIALEKNQQLYEIARMLDHETGIEWRLGSPLNLLDDIEQKFDIVLGSPPWNLKPESLTFTLENANIEIRDDADKLIILKSSLLMTQEGVGFFITSPNFTFKRSKNSVYENLSRFNLYIDAIFSLPNGTFPGTSIGGLLVIIRKQKSEKLFVGELSSNEASNDVLLSNFTARKQSKMLQLGALVDFHSFRSFQILITEHEIEKLSRPFGLQPMPFCKIVKEINVIRSIQDEESSNLQNVIYLPQIGRSRAVVSLDDIQMKPQNYYQVVLDPEKAIPAYMANFFNTKLGLLIRESLSSGLIIPKINKSQLSKANIYLPDLETQTKTVHLDTSISDHLTQLEILKRELWNKPRNIKNVEKIIKSFTAKNDLESWMETLPFPLASILWAYYADADTGSKVDNLLNFFEALSEFTATVLLSAFMADMTFYVQKSEKWIDKDPKYKEWIKTSTFGGWNVLSERLGKETRHLLNSENERERFIELFGHPDIDFLEMFVNKKIFSVLRDVAAYRNQWKGHAGIASSQELDKQLKILESKLSNIRQVISDRYTTVSLLSPESNEFCEGIYYYKAKNLMGTRTTFKKITVKTLTPMDKRKLYLIHSNQFKPIMLLPFIRLMESPKTQQNACYFYNRVNKEGVRWVSYHFESEAVIVRPDDEVISTISLLNSTENIKEVD
jgi:hypothetical protein